MLHRYTNETQWVRLSSLAPSTPVTRPARLVGGLPWGDVIVGVGTLAWNMLKAGSSVVQAGSCGAIPQNAALPSMTGRYCTTVLWARKRLVQRPMHAARLAANDHQQQQLPCGS